MVKNRCVLVIILGVAIFASTGLSGAYAYSDQMQSQDQQPLQHPNFGAHNYPHNGNHHRGLPQGTAGYNMTSFNQGNHQRAFSHNMTGYNMTLFNQGNHQRAFSHNMTGYNTTTSNNSIPSWVKSTTKYWSQGQVNDTDFVGGLQYMIKTGIIQVPPTQAILGNSHQIPKWVKSDANLWATGQMSEREFIQSIQYLISTGIIRPGS